MSELKLSAEDREFVTAEFRKVMAGAVALKTNLSDGGSILDVYLPNERSVLKAQNLWQVIAGEAAAPLPGALISHTFVPTRNMVHVAFEFVDVGDAGKGAEFLAAAGDALKVIAFNWSDSEKAASKNPARRRSPEAQAYRNADRELSAALQQMLFNNTIGGRI